MLHTLFIRDYALIDELNVALDSGLNIITGETGAGKSIILGALGLLLGDRASAESVRKGAAKAVIEGTLDMPKGPKLRELLTAHGLDVEEQILLRREVSGKGTSRAFINDSPTSITVLREVGEQLIDLHGQHEHQSLLRVETHLGLLDEFGGLGGLVAEYRAGFDRLAELHRQRRDLRAREAALREKQQLYGFQIAEIDAVAPQPGEDAELETERTILENAERLFADTSGLYQTLYESDDAIYDRLVAARNTLEDLARIDRTFADGAEECRSAEAIVQELVKFIQNYNSRIEFNPERLTDVRERLATLQRLKKSYGGSVEDVIAYRRTIGAEHELVDNFELAVEKLTKAVHADRLALSKVAERLTAKRREVGERLSRQVADELRDLGIAHGLFEARIEDRPDPTGDVMIDGRRIAAGPRGVDQVEFFISTNLGEDPKPLARVASGGEISRVMLAMKSILAKSDRLPILIFDEIDTGVSGRVAQSVGFALKELSRFHQIVAITHLPQIAGLADAHYLVEKRVEDGRTRSSLRPLSLGERVREVATLMSGAEITPAALRSAEELIAASRQPVPRPKPRRPPARPAEASSADG